MKASRPGIKFLQAIRKKTGKAPPLLTAAPALSPMEAGHFDAFLLLRPSTPTPISTVDIIAYAHAMHYRDIMMFIRLIKAMDATYIAKIPSPKERKR